MTTGTPHTGPTTDHRLSYKARGIWVALVNLANEDLAVDSAFNRLLESSDKDGQQAIRKGVEELENHGYLHKIVLRYPRGDGPRGGKISGYRWKLNPNPAEREGEHQVAA